jgi:hypothetical protein
MTGKKTKKTEKELVTAYGPTPYERAAIFANLYQHPRGKGMLQ